MSYGGCKGSQWLMVNTLFCITHIVAAFYLAMQSKSWNETMHTLCHDPWIAAYILVGIGSFVWLGIGTGWAASGEMENGNCPDNIGELSSSSIYCGFAFFGFASFGLCLAVLLSLCLGRKEEQDEKTYQVSGGSYYAATDKV